MPKVLDPRLRGDDGLVKPGPGRRHSGLTLLELMVVLVIVALLTTLAWPGFVEHFQRVRRQDAMTTLLRIQLQQEQWRAQDTDYATLAELGWGTAQSLAGHYRLELRARGPAGYRVIARPRRNGAQAGDPCGAFALDQDGPVLGSGFAGARCWRG
ncbi:hypothetical protein TspCOW1_17380 [Thiohalobacter sp. COW1]|uniref:type IV pilin protein n=1 Tax=Thiohalobacter sp. COW1 TaxID=2795687 RepID=UPI0019159550|nr:type IV pilin protein [Thiohalobacter sp. COW1]BCO31635.1 hypothetical protein TspCOW1_17380 [Thiohalobacter sp. COW1]